MRKNFMSISIYFRTLWQGRLVGKDSEGNRYYEDKTTTRYGKPRRWVIYKGRAEASKIPALWHGWLHYTAAEPDMPDQRYPWQKEHLPNLTGTSRAYQPKGLRGNPPFKDYEAWKPPS
jgi:NADH:ubiquinone oxidoreductase subunit